MPIREIVVSIRVDPDASDGIAIADASKYLAYADQTDTFGYHAEIEEVRRAHPGSLVTIGFRAPIENDEALVRFTDELDQLARAQVWTVIE